MSRAHQAMPATVSCGKRKRAVTACSMQHADGDGDGQASVRARMDDSEPVMHVPVELVSDAEAVLCISVEGF